MVPDTSERFAVEDRQPLILELLLGHPHLLECCEGCQDGASNEGREHPLRGGRYANLDVLGGELPKLAQQSVAEEVEHGGPARQHYVGEQRLPQVQIGTLDRIVEQFVNAMIFQAHEARVEQDLRRPEALGAQRDCRTVWELVLVLPRGLVVLDLLFFRGVHRAIALCFLDLLNDFLFRGGVEDGPGTAEELRELLGDVPARDVRAHHRVRHDEAFVHGHGVRDAIARIEHHACGPAHGVQG
mmetsp:Transcript_67876/g.207985  ORF Transcript_67876/g.207985 Transcript_67876/m.207985 type:complete len:242 (-) Transcript_67876:548-1273(-)